MFPSPPPVQSPTPPTSISPSVPPYTTPSPPPSPFPLPPPKPPSLASFPVIVSYQIIVNATDVADFTPRVLLDLETAIMAYLGLSTGMVQVTATAGSVILHVTIRTTSEAAPAIEERIGNATPQQTTISFANVTTEDGSPIVVTALSAPADEAPDSASSKDKLSSGAVAGVVIGAIIGVALIIGLVAFCIRKMNRDIPPPPPAVTPSGTIILNVDGSSKKPSHPPAPPVTTTSSTTLEPEVKEPA